MTASPYPTPYAVFVAAQHAWHDHIETIAGRCDRDTARMLWRHLLSPLGRELADEYAEALSAGSAGDYLTEAFDETAEAAAVDLVNAIRDAERDTLHSLGSLPVPPLMSSAAAPGWYAADGVADPGSATHLSPGVSAGSVRGADPALGAEDESHDITCDHCLGVPPCPLVDDFAAMTEEEAS